LRVVPLVGPSAILLSLMASGLNGQAFTFHGYLPVDTTARSARLRAIDDDLTRTGVTHLFIETPHRNHALLAAILATCRRATHLCVAADLTLPTEWIASAAVSDWEGRSAAALARRPAMFLLGRSA
jgi:16S rRNA (cytidine1402-2'-O)-methyltransferase